MEKVVKKNENKNGFLNFNLLVRKVFSLWYVLVISILVGVLTGVLYYSVISTPKYESSSMVYLRSSNKKLTLDTLQLSTSLTQDYQVIFTSRPNLQNIITNLHLKYSVDELKNMITIENPSDTRILKVSVVSTSPIESKNIANLIVKEGMDDIREIDSQEPYLIEDAIENNQRIGLSLIKMSILCAMSGLFIALGIIIIKFLINDSFTSSDDVENTLGLPVLAVIAEDQSLTYAKLESSNSRRRKHHGKKTSK